MDAIWGRADMVKSMVIFSIIDGYIEIIFLFETRETEKGFFIIGLGFSPCKIEFLFSFRHLYFFADRGSLDMILHISL